MNPRNQYLAVGIGAARLAATFTLRPAAVMLVTEARGADESNSPVRFSGFGHHGTRGSGKCGAV